jgi:hypothetical protein
MKKYYGKKEWSESLYLADIYEGGWDGSGEINDKDFIHRYLLGLKFDWRHIIGFPDTNQFEDTNSFITYPEGFNIYQSDKI